MKDFHLPATGGERAQPRLLVVGDVMLDRVIQGDAGRLSVEAPVPIILQTGEQTHPGGAANVAANLAALGAEVILAGVVGEDGEADALEEAVRRKGVDDIALVRRGAVPTTVKTRIVARRQQIARVDREEIQPLDRVTRDRLLAILEREVPRAGAVLVPDYGKGVVSGPLWTELVRLCGASKAPLMVDPGPRAAAADYRHATLVKPNWAEAVRAVTEPGEATPGLEEIGNRWLAASSARAVLVTRGEQGMSLFRPQQPRFDLAARRREVFDVTGAGDTVLAALGWAHASGLPLEESARLANLAGGLAVERFGTASISRRDLERALVPESALEDKVIPRDRLPDFLQGHRRAGRSIVFTNGCFDILHPGHLRLLRHCSTCGDVVVVGLNSDDSVRRLKGPSRPVLAARDRALVLAALPEVDAVVVFSEDTPAELLQLVLPDVLVKGGDYNPEDVVGRDLVESRGGRLELIPLREGISTTTLVDRMQK